MKQRNLLIVTLLSLTLTFILLLSFNVDTSFITDDAPMPTLAVLPEADTSITEADVFVPDEAPEAVEITEMEPDANSPQIIVDVEPTIRPEPQITEMDAQPVPEQVVIRFQPDTSEAEKAAYLMAVGGEVTQEIAALDTVVIQVDETQTIPESEVVQTSEPDYYVTALLSLPVSDPLYAEQWNLDYIGAPDNWLKLPDSTDDVIVAVIDSGACFDHPDMAGRYLNNGYDFIDNDSTPQDEFGHGCGVSGIIAANVDDGIGLAGIAPNAKIMPLRVLNASGIGTYSDVAAALIYAADNGADIINLSLGGTNSSRVLHDAVKYAAERGVQLVGASGNSGASQPLYPANYSEVIAVGAVDRDGNTASFSNGGVSTLAPGVDVPVLRLNAGYDRISGTSFAAPHIAGMLALESGVDETIVIIDPEANEQTDEIEYVPDRAGHNAHYFVFTRKENGVIEPQMHRYVTIQDLTESLSAAQVDERIADTSRYFEPAIVQLVDANGNVVFQTVEELAGLLRSEDFFSESENGEPRELTGELIEVEETSFAVRVPIIEGTRLVIQDETAANSQSFDIDALVEDEALPLRNYNVEAFGGGGVKSEPNRINVVIIGDGYTAAQESNFYADAQGMMDDFMSDPLMADYRNFYNLIYLFHPSAESGADHPPYSASCTQSGFGQTCCGDWAASYDPKAQGSGTFVDTAFDATYCGWNTQRLLVVNSSKVYAAAAVVSDWDALMVLVNDTQWGGAGGGYATTANVSARGEIMLHEFGHAYVGLADEYESPYYGTCSDINGSSSCEPNVTNETRRDYIKWNEWILPSTPIITPETSPYYNVVGLFEGARYQSTGMYRPQYNCIMRSTGSPYCVVDSEEFLMIAYRDDVNTIEPGGANPPTSSPLSITVLETLPLSVDVLQPSSSYQLYARWKVNGTVAQEGYVGEYATYDFHMVEKGSYWVTVEVFDMTDRIRPSRGKPVNSVQWSIDVTGDYHLTCINAVDIPPEECQTLVDLYNSTNGDNWYQNTGWLTDTTIGNWYGVNVSGGHVTGLFLGDNNLAGTLPDTLYYLNYVEEIWLYYNLLVGDLPSGIGSMGNLRILSLADNQLTGSLVQLANASTLTHLYLANNQFSGDLPWQLGVLTNLEVLSVPQNRLSGWIAPSIGSMSSLRELVLDNNSLSGPMPLELGNLSNLEVFTLSNNSLSGVLPPHLSNLTKLRILSLSKNHFSGGMPASLSNTLTHLFLEGNQFTGEVPNSTVFLSNLVMLEIGYNGLYTTDNTVRSFLDAADPDWQSTQTQPPTNITADSSHYSVTLNWAPIYYTWNGGYYEISYKRQNDTDYQVAGTTADKSVSSFTIKNLQRGVPYDYRIRTYTPAHGNNINAIWSDYSVVFTYAIPIPPLTAPDNLVSTETTRNSAMLSWDDTFPAETDRFFIERDDGSGFVELVQITSLKTTFKDDTLLCGHSYDYRVRAYRLEDDGYSNYATLLDLQTAACPDVVPNFVGLYKDGVWQFRDTNETGTADIQFEFGPKQAGWLPIVGDWDTDTTEDVDGIGLYKDGLFILRQEHDAGSWDMAFNFGPQEPGWLPIVGDWNGDDVDTVGVYKDGLFMLTDANETGGADYTFQFGGENPGYLPIVGDWNGSGTDSVGLYKDGSFYLTNTLRDSTLSRGFTFGPTQTGWLPLVGDWDEDGITTIGVYQAGVWRLRNSNSQGISDNGFSFGSSTAAVPIASYRGGAEGLMALSVSMEQPTEEPTLEPEITETAEPTQQPEITVEPTITTAEPEITAEPTITTAEPEITVEPTITTAEPEITAEPTAESTIEPTAEPTQQPTTEPTAEPTQQPTTEPTVEPTQEPEPEAVASE